MSTKPPNDLEQTKFESTLSGSDKIEVAQENINQVHIFDKTLEQQVRRKLDWNIIPLVTIVYMLSVLDRSNIGNARIAGMETDLHLYGNRYEWLLTIFYIPCIPVNGIADIRYFI